MYAFHWTPKKCSRKVAGDLFMAPERQNGLEERCTIPLASAGALVLVAVCCPSSGCALAICHLDARDTQTETGGTRAPQKGSRKMPSTFRSCPRDRTSLGCAT